MRTLRLAALTAAALLCAVRTVVSQSSGPVREASSATIAIGYGPATSTWFSGLYATDGLNAYDDKLGGLTVALKILVARNSRLRLGGEVGIFMIKEGESGGELVGNTCYDCYSQTDDAGIHFNALASLRLATLGRVTWRVEGGGGFVFFNLNDAGPGKKRNFAREFNTGTPYFTSAPSVEPIVVARLVPAVRIGGSDGGANFAIDQHVSIMKTFGKAAASATAFGLGFVLQLPRRSP